MQRVYEVAKYDRRVWSVFNKVTRTFSYIGKGKRYCEEKANELNSINP